MREMILLSEDQTNECLFSDVVFDDNHEDVVLFKVVQKKTTHENKEKDIAQKDVVIKRLADDKYFYRSLTLSPKIRNTESAPWQEVFFNETTNTYE
jgi:hypothetical protein